MDDFSRTILKDLLPREKEIRVSKRTKIGREDALDHLASVILLERAAYLRKLAELSDGSASEILKSYPQHAIHLLVRSRNGGAEQHARFADIFFVLEGRATLATGGIISNAKTVSPGEVRGDDVKDGSLQELRTGDVAHVPAGLPHQMLVAGEKTVTCMVIKIEQTVESDTNPL